MSEVPQVRAARRVSRGAPAGREGRGGTAPAEREREFFIDNLMVRIHLIIEMIWWTGLAPWEFEFPFPGSLISTFLPRPRYAPHAESAAAHRLVGKGGGERRLNTSSSARMYPLHYGPCTLNSEPCTMNPAP